MSITARELRGKPVKGFKQIRRERPRDAAGHLATQRKCGNRNAPAEMRGPAGVWEREIGPLRRSTVVLILCRPNPAACSRRPRGREDNREGHPGRGGHRFATGRGSSTSRIRSALRSSRTACSGTWFWGRLSLWLTWANCSATGGAEQSAVGNQKAGRWTSDVGPRAPGGHSDREIPHLRPDIRVSKSRS